MSLPDPNEVVRRVLEPGEELVWAGRPSRREYVWRRGAKLRFWLPLGLYALLFAALGAASLSGHPIDKHSLVGMLIPLVGGLFLVPIIFCTMPVFHRMLGHSNLVYALTSRRVIELEHDGKACRLPTRIYELCISTPRVIPARDGHGVLVFAPDPKGWIRWLVGFDDAAMYGLQDPHGLLKNAMQQPYFRRAVEGPALRPELKQDSAPLLKYPSIEGEEDSNAALAQDLLPGEHLLWAGRPDHLAIKLFENAIVALLGGLLLLAGMSMLWNMTRLIELLSGLDSVWQQAVLIGFPILLTMIGGGMIICHIVSRLRNPRGWVGVTSRRLLVTIRKPNALALTQLRQVMVRGHNQEQSLVDCIFDSTSSQTVAVQLATKKPAELRRLLLVASGIEQAS